MKIRLALLLSLIASPAAADDVTFTPTGWIETRLRTIDFDELTLDTPAAAIGGTLALGPVDARVILDRGDIQEAHFGATHGALSVRAGTFLSPIGIEVAPVNGNWNWSRSLLFNGLPFDHTGARVNYAVGGWTFTGALYTGWDDVDTNDEKSVSVSAAFALGAVSGQFLYFGGVERQSDDPEGLAWRHLIDAYVTVSLGGPELALHVDGGLEDNDVDTNQWIGAALYARVPIVDGLRLAARGDFLSEAHGGASPIFGLEDEWVASGTATLDWHGVDHLRVMLEYRFDRPAESVDVHTLTLGATAFF